MLSGSSVTSDLWLDALHRVLDELDFRPRTSRFSGPRFGVAALDLRDGRHILASATPIDTGSRTIALRFDWIDGPVGQVSHGTLATLHIETRPEELRGVARRTVVELVEQAAFPAAHPELADTFWTLIHDGQLDLTDIIAVCRQLA
jgi:hypothetical protein